jgi:hypothetical protein
MYIREEEFLNCYWTEHLFNVDEMTVNTMMIQALAT